MHTSDTLILLFPLNFVWPYYCVPNKTSNAPAPMYVPTLYKKVFLLCDFNSFSNCNDFSRSNPNCSSFFNKMVSKFKTLPFSVVMTESFRTTFFCSNFRSSWIDTSSIFNPS